MNKFINQNMLNILHYSAGTAATTPTPTPTIDEKNLFDNVSGKKYNEKVIENLPQELKDASTNKNLKYGLCIALATADASKYKSADKTIFAINLIEDKDNCTIYMDGVTKEGKIVTFKNAYILFGDNKLFSMGDITYELKDDDKSVHFLFATTNEEASNKKDVKTKIDSLKKGKTTKTVFYEVVEVKTGDEVTGLQLKELKSKKWLWIFIGGLFAAAAVAVGVYFGKDHFINANNKSNSK